MLDSDAHFKPTYQIVPSALPCFGWTGPREELKLFSLHSRENPFQVVQKAANRPRTNRPFRSIAVVSRTSPGRRDNVRFPPAQHANSAPKQKLRAPHQSRDRYVTAATCCGVIGASETVLWSRAAAARTAHPRAMIAAVAANNPRGPGPEGRDMPERRTPAGMSDRPPRFGLLRVRNMTAENHISRRFRGKGCHDALVSALGKVSKAVENDD